MSNEGPSLVQPGENNPLKEQFELRRAINNIIEFYAANGLGKPLLVVTNQIEKPQAKGDDTLSRLEALVEPPSVKTTSELKGIFLPLGLTPDDKWLYLEGGDNPKIVIFSPPDVESNYFYNSFLENFFHREILELGPDDYNYFLETYLIPEGKYPFYMTYVLATSLLASNPTEMEEKLKGYLEQAKKIALERKKLLEEQTNRALTLAKEILDPNNL